MVTFSNQHTAGQHDLRSSVSGGNRTFAVGHIRRGRQRMVVVPRDPTFAFPGPWEVRAVVLVS